MIRHVRREEPNNQPPWAGRRGRGREPGRLGGRELRKLSIRDERRPPLCRAKDVREGTAPTGYQKSQVQDPTSEQRVMTRKNQPIKERGHVENLRKLGGTYRRKSRRDKEV